MPKDEFARFEEKLARSAMRREIAEGLAKLRKGDRKGLLLAPRRERKKGGAGSSGAPAALYRTKH